MEPISTAIIAAAAAGIFDGVKGAVDTAVTDAYAGLKALIVNRFGTTPPVVAALERYEDTPDSARRQSELVAIFAEHGVAADTDIAAAGHRLADALTLVHQPVQIIVHGDGATIVPGAHATITVTHTFTRK